MNRRTFLAAQTIGAAGSAFMGVSGYAAAESQENIKEDARSIPVIDSADVLVLGGGPAGCAAAIAAARLGRDVLLVERYGYLGGMATGGLVILYAEYDRALGGIVSEIGKRIIADGGRMVETNRAVKNEPFFNPELYKYICLDMALKANVRLLFHAWAVGARLKESAIDAVIIESKSGRQALKAKVVVDCTGDADTAEWTGVPFENTLDSGGLGIDFIYGNVDFDAFRQFTTYNPDEWKRVRTAAREQNIDWEPWYIGLNDRAWFNTSYKGDPVNVQDLSKCEIELRLRIMKHWEFYRKNVPGFIDATIMLTATQIGVRFSRQILGEHVLTMDDLNAGKFNDTIGKVCPNVRLKEGILCDVPYRCLVPKKIDNLLYAGRCISATREVIGRIRALTGCTVIGQGAGVAAALSIAENSPPRKLQIDKLQKTLRDQGVVI